MFTHSLNHDKYLHQYAHHPPAVIRTTLWKRLVQLDSRMLLLLIVPYPHIGHEEVRKDLLVLGIVDSSISIHLGYLQI